MLYHVTRNGQSYGPYTLEDLARYVASGNINPSDLAKSGEMTEWVPVSTLLGSPAATVPPPTGFPPIYPAIVPPPMGTYDSPPRLNWIWVLIFTLFTCGLFAAVWSIVESAWLNRVAPMSRQLALGIGVVVGSIVIYILDNHNNRTFNTSGWSMETHHTNPVVSILQIAYLVLIIYARFNMRNWMERHYNTVEPIGLRLSGVMTFFFGGLYFQYHMNRINDIKQAMSYRAPGV